MALARAVDAARAGSLALAMVETVLHGQELAALAERVGKIEAEHATQAEAELRRGRWRAA